MTKRIKGTIIKFGTKNYGFILGDNGEKYFVNQRNVHNQLRLKLDTRVLFTPEVSEKGLIAVGVSTIKLEVLNETSLSKATIKGMFLFLLVMQIIAFIILFKQD